MKIIYIKSGWCSDFELLEKENHICGISVLFVDGVRDIHDISLVDRKDTEHFITFDRDDFHLGTRGITARTDYDDYMYLEKKILSRIEEKDTIILITDRLWKNDDVDFMIYLMQKKPFNLHVIKQICPSYDSNDYHEFLRIFDDLQFIRSIGYIKGNLFRTSEDDTDEEWDMKEELNRKHLFSKLFEIIPNIQYLDENKFYIYNHDKKQYIETQRPYYSGDSMLEFVTPSENENMCEILYTYRKAFADKYNLAYDSKPCSECECKGICKSVCKECDWKSQRLWEKKYIDPYEDFDTGEEKYPYKYNRQINVDINGIDRLRIDTDGKGIRSLILMAGCPLDCKYCGNKKYKEIFPETENFSVDELGYKLEKDGIYYEITEGGVTFGGGEPLLRADFIHEFHKKYPMWDVVIETCLNVDFSEIDKIASDVVYWYVDIKDINSEIYKRYTGMTNEKVIFNLENILSIIPSEKICIRIPRIPNYNNEKNIEQSVKIVKRLGFKNIDIFDYNA